MEITYESIAQRIDHALLSPTMTAAEMVQGCQLAALHEVATVCIKPHAVKLAFRALADSSVKVGTVVGFPLGGQTIASKVFETAEAIESGASEVDMVVNIGEVRSGNWTHIEAEIRQVSAEVRKRQAILKVIFETCYLSDEQKIRLCEICSKAQVDYVKTSTGFGTGGATASDLILMRRHTEPSVKLKASGGIKDLSTAIEFCELGAERLGLSRTSEILGELEQKLNLPQRNVPRETFSKEGQRHGSY